MVKAGWWMDTPVWAGHDPMMAEVIAGTEQQVSAPRRQLAMATPLLGAVCMVVGFLTTWNPWRLLVLDGRGGLAALTAMMFGVLMVGVGAARLVGRRRRAWWWVSVCVGALGGSLVVLFLLAVALSGMLSPLAGKVLDEDRVSTGNGVTVVRRAWSVGLRYSCVEFEVRAGHGLWTRSGPRTSCVVNRHSPDWELSVAGDTVVVVRSDGSTCRYTVDRSGLRLVAEDAVACDALVVK